MRQIILDTETTGLEPSKGHRIVEIGCIEVVNRRITGREYHSLLNPEREIDEGAEAVHGMNLADLANQPRFSDIADEFLEFISDAELVIHNAEFDVGFLEHELRLMKHPKPEIREHATIRDTLSFARKLHPGQRNSLDALCRRYDVDASRRNVHGALIDAELLAGVYLAMTGGQAALSLDEEIEMTAEQGRIDSHSRPVNTDLRLRVIRANQEENAAHEALLAKMRADGECVWREN
jgi:DNA polymerase-3 subunit epsilon